MLNASFSCRFHSDAPVNAADKPCPPEAHAKEVWSHEGIRVVKRVRAQLADAQRESANFVARRLTAQRRTLGGIAFAFEPLACVFAASSMSEFSVHGSCFGFM